MHTQFDATRTAPRWRWWSRRPRPDYCAPPTPTVSPDGSVARDLSCRRCGYNLRTLRADAHCPECALPVGASVGGDALLYSDPAWLSKITLGADLLALGWVLMAPTILSVFVFLPLFAVLAAATYGALLAGTWLLTRPDLSGAGEPAYGTSRKLARYLPLLALTVPFLDELRLAHPSFAPTPDLLTILFNAALGAGQLAGLVALMAMLTYLQSLAETRTDDTTMTERCPPVFVQLGSWGAAAILLAIAGRLPLTGGWMTGHTAMLTAANIFVFIATVRYVAILIHFRGVLHRHLDLAKQAWSAATQNAVSQG